jgi:hypothetical protein
MKWRINRESDTEIRWARSISTLPVFDTWEHKRKTDVLEKVVGDFSEWDTNAVKYGKAFEKLLKGLQAENVENDDN